MFCNPVGRYEQFSFRQGKANAIFRTMQGLLRELLSLCPADGAELRATVLMAIGASLSMRSMHEDAAVAFVAAGDLRAALQSYRAGGHWRMVMALAGECPCNGLAHPPDTNTAA